MKRSVRPIGRRRFTGLAAAAAATGLGLGTAPEIGSAQTVEWERTYDLGSDSDSGSVGARDTTPTRDGGYALLCTSIDYSESTAYVLLAKLGPAGELEWSRAYEETERNDFGVAVVELAGGGYAVAATNDGAAPDSELRLFLTDDEGDVRRSRTYAGADGRPEDAADLVEIRRDGETAGLAALATVGDWYSGDGRVRLRRVDAELSTTWERTYERGRNERAIALVRPASGGYAYAATAGPDYREQAGDYVLGRADDDGATRWARTYEETGGAAGLTEVTDGGETDGYAVVGTVGPVTDWRTDVGVVTTNCRGDRVSSELFDRAGTRDAAGDIAFTGDGFAICARTETEFEDQDYWLLRTDEGLDLQWAETYDQSLYSFGERSDQYDQPVALAARGDELTIAGTTLAGGSADAASPWVVNVLDE